MPFNPEKLAKLVSKTGGGPATVRTGGKGTVRRKHKAVRKTATHDDKRLKATLNKLAVRDIPAIEEVNLFKDDGSVIHFVNPKGAGQHRSQHVRGQRAERDQEAAGPAAGHHHATRSRQPGGPEEDLHLLRQQGGRHARPQRRAAAGAGAGSSGRRSSCSTRRWRRRRRRAGPRGELRAGVYHRRTAAAIVTAAEREQRWRGRQSGREEKRMLGAAAYSCPFTSVLCLSRCKLSAAQADSVSAV